jgi:hypothetical protein
MTLYCYSVDRFAVELGISSRSVKRMVVSGEVKSIRIGAKGRRLEPVADYCARREAIEAAEAEAAANPQDPVEINASPGQGSESAATPGPRPEPALA